MNNVTLIYSENFKKLDFGPGHPMRGDRYEKALEEFKKMNLSNNLVVKKPEIITGDIIGLFHTADYIKKVQEVGNTGQGSFQHAINQRRI